MTLDLKAIGQDPLRLLLFFGLLLIVRACPRCWSTGVPWRPGNAPR